MSVLQCLVRLPIPLPNCGASPENLSIPYKKSKTAFTNSSGLSIFGMCPQLSSTLSWAPYQVAVYNSAPILESYRLLLMSKVCSGPHEVGLLVARLLMSPWKQSRRTVSRIVVLRNHAEIIVQACFARWPRPVPCPSRC